MSDKNQHIHIARGYMARANGYAAIALNEATGVADENVLRILRQQVERQAKVANQRGTNWQADFASKFTQPGGGGS